MAGVSQKILNVQLDKRLIGEETLPAQWYREGIGGQGLAMRYLLEDLELKKPILKDPIILMTGPLTGTPLPGTSRASVLSYRSEARLLRITSVEGKFPAYLKLAGFDGLVISGRASSPARLLVSKRESRLVDASMLWGKDVIATEMEAHEEGRDMATLAIGPAGENGNPYATIITDRFLNRSAGSGCDFGIKNLKHISVEADGSLEIRVGMEKFVALISGDMKTHVRRFEAGETRRSCFGCVRCCWKYDPEDGFVFLQNDLGELEAILPGLSTENRDKYYRECSRLGIDFYTLAHAIKDEIADRNFEGSFVQVTSAKEACGNDCINTRSWEEAQLMLHRWYRDIDFRGVVSTEELVDKENAVMVKNCVPLCERWSMPLDITAVFLVSVCGFDYRRQELLNIGERLIRQGLRFYRDLGYAETTFGNDMVCEKYLPKVFVDQPERYLKLRGLTETGYPGNAG